jgi:glycosyltransferase involved in cell wall biosynthesis
MDIHSSMKVVITIPAYNEAATIGLVTREIKKVMDSQKLDYKILVVDDGSIDDTKALAQKSGAMVFSHPANYGLAEAFRTELEKCLELGADVIVHIDADGQYKATDIPKLLSKIRAGYDLVLGSRFLGHIEEMPLMKRLGNKAFSKVISNITRVKITDSQTGFRAFTKAVAQKVKVTSYHTYTQEQIIRAVRMKFRIAEVPVYFAKRHGKSRLISSPFEYAANAWINLLRIYRDYEPLKFFGFIGMSSVFVGFIIGLWLVFLYLTRGVVGKTPSLMLCVLLITMGVQVILFGFLADMKSG